MWTFLQNSDVCVLCSVWSVNVTAIQPISNSLKKLWARCWISSSFQLCVFWVCLQLVLLLNACSAKVASYCGHTEHACLKSCCRSSFFWSVTVFVFRMLQIDEFFFLFLWFNWVCFEYSQYFRLSQCLQCLWYCDLTGFVSSSVSIILGVDTFFLFVSDWSFLRV